ncbi:hypothetical protein FRB99_006947 [Tulasnella sp. 403]|nr:hypothetical protein FRB99_006947 [Tulasnella sp. 403]
MDTTNKYAHTKAFILQLAREYPSPSNSFVLGAENDAGDAVDGVSPGSKAGADLVKKVVRLLEEEDDEGLKSLITKTFPMEDSDPALLEQVVLDLMHKHKDDVQGVPFVFLSPMKRPISRPSSRASSHSYRVPRPETPSSPLVKSLSLRRPHTPVASPLSAGAHTSVIGNGVSPSSSPTISNVAAIGNPILASVAPHLAGANASSQPSSPISSPHFLNAKAVDSSLTRSNSGLRKSIPGDLNDDGDNEDASKAFRRIDDDEHDEFSPFSKANAMNMPKSTANTHLNQYEDVAPPYPYPAHLQSTIQADEGDELSDSNGYNNHVYPGLSFNPGSSSSFNPYLSEQDPTGSAADGMTPFEVLHSVFGSSVPPATLEDALGKNGYDFELAMAWLVDTAGKATGGAVPGVVSTAPPPKPTPIPVAGSGGRVMTVSRDVLPLMRSGAANTVALGGNAQYFGQRPALATGGRCMKGEQCEFLHTLPQDIDISPLTSVMSGVDLNADRQSGRESPPVDAFPTLAAARRVGQLGNSVKPHDPSRTRFAAAVKKPPPPTVTPNTASQRNTPVHLGVRRIPGDRTTPATPRPSPRLKLRPPSLLPTLPTGKIMNDLYMTYRARAIELGGARNQALSRAAEAWKRGDGAAAKHWSRQANELNGKMAKEMAEAAERLVKERANAALEAISRRPTSWSDDPLDRGSKGKVAGGGFGVLLGVASANVGGVNVTGGKLSSEERTECLLDLHGLHSSEGVEVLEVFLLAVSTRTETS